MYAPFPARRGAARNSQVSQRQKYIPDRNSPVMKVKPVRRYGHLEGGGLFGTIDHAISCCRLLHSGA